MTHHRQRTGEVSGTKHECECCMCDKPFQLAAPAYEARKVAQWCGLMICNDCERASRGGISLEKYPRLLQNLQILRVRLVADKTGWIPLPQIGAGGQPAAAGPARHSSPDRQNVIPLRVRAA
jgi:hypothetical protein